MRAKRFQPLILPALVLAAGLAIGAGAEIAVGRYEAYGVYGLARPVADLTLAVGGVWLIIALIRIGLAGRRR